MKNRVLLHIANFAAPYMGNFIESLAALEGALRAAGNRMIYVFPETCRKTAWIDGFMSGRQVYFVESKIDTMKVFYNRKLIEQLAVIFTKERPDIIHSHFDGYDIPVVLANKKSGLGAKIIWHHHNPRTLVSNPIKRLYQKGSFYRQYRVYGKQVNIIAVSESCLDELRSYGFDMDRTQVINNGICEHRIFLRDIENFKGHSVFTFLCFGGRGDHKGIDILLDAVKMIRGTIPFKLILVRGTDTEQYLSIAFETIPPEIEVVDPVSDINALFERADCFISCSRRETFSYAVHEAALYGLPIISSEIPALRMINRQPSVRSFASENAQELAAAMKRMVTDGGQYDPGALLATRKYIEEHFTISVWTREVMAYYGTVLNTKGDE